MTRDNYEYPETVEEYDERRDGPMNNPESVKPVRAWGAFDSKGRVLEVTLNEIKAKYSLLGFVPVEIRPISPTSGKDENNYVTAREILEAGEEYMKGMSLGGKNGLAAARMDQRMFYKERCEELKLQCEKMRDILFKCANRLGCGCGERGLCSECRKVFDEYLGSLSDSQPEEVKPDKGDYKTATECRLGVENIGLKAEVARLKEVNKLLREEVDALPMWEKERDQLRKENERLIREFEEAMLDSSRHTQTLVSEADQLRAKLTKAQDIASLIRQKYSSLAVSHPHIGLPLHEALTTLVDALTPSTPDAPNTKSDKVSSKLVVEPTTQEPKQVGPTAEEALEWQREHKIMVSPYLSIWNAYEFDKSDDSWAMKGFGKTPLEAIRSAMRKENSNE